MCCSDTSYPDAIQWRFFNILHPETKEILRKCANVLLALTMIDIARACGAHHAS